MHKAIIFDFYDVIRADAYKIWLNKHNYKLEGEFLETAQKLDSGKITFDEFINHLNVLTGQSSDSILEAMNDNLGVDYKIIEIINQLRDKYKIGLLSNASSSFLRNLLREHDLEKYFDEIVISSEVGLTKPSAEIYHHILSKMKVQPGEAIFIDDNEKNVDGAQSIGMHALVYKDTSSLKEELDKLIGIL